MSHLRLKKLISLLPCCLILWSMSGQPRPSILLEDTDEFSLDVKCYCNPGVRNKTRSKGLELSYQFLGSGEITTPNGEISEPFPSYSKFRKFRSKLALPIIRTPQVRTIIGFSHEAEQYEIEELSNDFLGLIGATDDLNFKSTTFDIAFSFSPNEYNYIGAKFNLSYNGSYAGLVDFSSQFAIYSGAVAYGIKKNEDNEWGFGLAGSKNFRDQGFRVLPFVFWNKTFNDHWGFQFTFPTSYNLRYTYDPKTIVVLGANYNGESYSFDQKNNDNRTIAFNHSEILSVLKLEREIVPWLWLDLQAGYHFNFNSDFELQETQESLLDIDPGNSILLKFGIFISPPDSFINRTGHTN